MITKKMLNVFEIDNITSEILNYYLNDPIEAYNQYMKLTTFAKSRGLDKSSLDGYYEVHHIIPRCKSGSNDEDNLVLLTYKEHVLAHMLLYASDTTEVNFFRAFSFMIEVYDLANFNISIDLNVLENLKIIRSEIMSGEKNPMKNPEIAKKVSEFKKKQKPFFEGKHHTDETKKILSEKTKALGWTGEKHPMFGRKHTEEARKKMSDKLRGENHPLFGKHLKDSTKQKLSEAHKEKVISPEGVIYESIRDAAKAIGIARETLSKWINHIPEKGWKKL